MWRRKIPKNNPELKECRSNGWLLFPEEGIPEGIGYSKRKFIIRADSHKSIKNTFIDKIPEIILRVKDSKNIVISTKTSIIILKVTTIAIVETG